MASTTRDDAWKAVVAADKRRNLRDVLEAIVAWLKAQRDAATFADVERRLRAEGRNTFLFGRERYKDEVIKCPYEITQDAEFGLEVSTEVESRARAYGAQFVSSEAENLRRLERAGLTECKDPRSLLQRGDDYGGTLELHALVLPRVVYTRLAQQSPDMDPARLVLHTRGACSLMLQGKVLQLPGSRSMFSLLPSDAAEAEVAAACNELEKQVVKVTS